MVSMLVGWLLSGGLLVGWQSRDPNVDQGVLKIYVSGREIGSEEYRLWAASDGIHSHSVLDFRNPSGPPNRLRFESSLDMDGSYRPRSYRLDTDVDGLKGRIVGGFAPNQAMFEYSGRGAAKKSGVLVGADYVILDANLFHHFLFLIRRFDFESREKSQRFEVVIPQANESGFVSVRAAGKEAVTLAGKKVEATRLEVDSGAKLIELWVDRSRTFYRLRVPAQQIEVVRGSDIRRLHFELK